MGQSQKATYAFRGQDLDIPARQVTLQVEKVHLNGCRRSLDQAEVDKSKVSEKLLDAQHEILHLKSSLEVMLANYC